MELELIFDQARDPSTLQSLSNDTYGRIYVNKNEIFLFKEISWDRKIDFYSKGPSKQYTVYSKMTIQVFPKAKGQ